jgi:hypothetical protein
MVLGKQAKIINDKQVRAVLAVRIGLIEQRAKDCARLNQCDDLGRSKTGGHSKKGAPILMEGCVDP